MPGHVGKKAISYSSEGVNNQGIPYGDYVNNQGIPYGGYKPLSAASP